MKRKDLIGGIQEECPHCKGIMNLESSKEKMCLNEYTYWWACSDCGRVYNYDIKTLLFIRR